MTVSQSKPIILCVDDEPLILKLYKRVIEQELIKQIKNSASTSEGIDWSSFFSSFELRLARNGHDAIGIAQKEVESGNRIAVGLFDVRMPGISGLETIREIIKIDSFFQCVVVTGYTEDPLEEFSSLPLCFDQLSYINKPFSAQEILQTTINQLSAWILKKERKQHLNHIKEINQTLEEKVNCRTRELLDKNIQISENNRHLSLLLDMSQTVSSSLDIKEILHLLVRKLALNVNASFCRIAFLENNLQSLHIHTSFIKYSQSGWMHMDDFEVDLFSLTFVRQLVNEKLPLVITKQDIINRKPPHVEAMLLGGKEIKSGLMLPLILKGEIIGLVYLGEYRSLERENFTLQKISLCQTILNTTVVAIENARLFYDTQKIFLSTIKSLAATVDAKDPYTNNHSRKVACYAEILARHCGLDELSCQRLKIASLLHDIGKIGVQDQILQKPSELSFKEFNAIKLHPEIGERILKPIDRLADVSNIIKHHHERYDGAGYPFGLAQNEIPCGSRILSVADSFDAMTCVRIYRSKIKPEAAFKEIQECSGSQFDPDIAGNFIKAYDEIMEKYLDIHVIKDYEG
ncbi:MAG: HD domain-containing phosphohydrolase [bacterium]